VIEGADWNEVTGITDSRPGFKRRSGERGNWEEKKVGRFNSI
jgi:hypothetical protein